MRFLGLWAAFVMLASTASAATLVFDTGGKLTGASDVVIGSSLYAVSFHDGTCTSVFSGCNEASDLDFEDAESALAAGQALLDQVLIGSVDDTPGLQYGCTLSRRECINIIPYKPIYTVPGSPVLITDAVRVVNFDSLYPATINDLAYDSDFRANESTVDGVFSRYAFARFTETGTISTVPLPAAGWLMLVGLGGLSAMRIRKTGNPRKPTEFAYAVQR